jgi:mannosyltransferase
MRDSLQLQTELSHPDAAPGAASAPGVSPWSAGAWVLPPLAVLFGFVLRMLSINHESVSGDEAFSMSVSRMPLRQMLPTLVQDYVHPPLHYFALRGWFKLFGYGLFQARLLSAVFGTLAIVFVYLLAEYLFGRRIALLASLLLGVSQLGIMFSQEVRPYAQFHFLALCTAYLFLRAFREGRPLFWWSFVASAILMLYTDYFSLYLIIALMMLPLIDRGASRLRLWWVLSGGALIFLSFLPWLASGVLHAAATANKTFMGKEAYAAVHWWTLVSIVNSFNNGKPAGLRADSPWWSYIVGGLLFSAPLLLLVVKWRPATNYSAVRLYRQNIIFATLLCVVPVLLTLLVGRILQIPYNVRYVSFCAAFYYILLACALFELKWQPLRWTVVALIVLYSANALRANYLMRWKEHWTEAFAYVQQNRQTADCGVFLPDFIVPPQWPITEAGRPSFRTLPQDRVAAELAGCPRVWEVSWAPRDDFRWLRQHEANNRLLALTFSKIDEQHYYGVNVALYSRAAQ